jgi:hypothetical protein
LNAPTMTTEDMEAQVAAMMVEIAEMHRELADLRGRLDMIDDVLAAAGPD